MSDENPTVEDVAPKNKGGRPRKVEPLEQTEDLEFIPSGHAIKAGQELVGPAAEQEEEIQTFDRLRRDGRKSGGQFGLYRYEVVDQVTKRVRTLRAPLHLGLGDLPLGQFETIPSKKRVQEFYDDEGERDRVLAAQCDPKTGRSYGWGPFDPAARHAVIAGGKTLYGGNDGKFGE